MARKKKLEPSKSPESPVNCIEHLIPIQEAPDYATDEYENDRPWQILQIAIMIIGCALIAGVFTYVAHRTNNPVEYDSDK